MSAHRKPLCQAGALPLAPLYVARAVRPEQYNEKPMLQWSYYSYWSNLPVDGFEINIRPDRGWAAVATNDGLTMLVVGWPYAESAAYKADVEANYLKTLDLAPEFAARVRGANREERFAGGSVPNFFRRRAMTSCGLDVTCCRISTGTFPLVASRRS